MKKVKKHTIYKLLNYILGEELLINFKPKKKELVAICKSQGWSGGDEDRIEEAIISSNYTFFKVDLYER